MFLGSSGYSTGTLSPTFTSGSATNLALQGFANEQQAAYNADALRRAQSNLRMAEQAGDLEGVDKYMYEIAKLERTMGAVGKGLDILSDPGGYASGYTQGLGDLFQVGADLNIPILSPIFQSGSDFLGGVTDTLRGSGS